MWWFFTQLYKNLFDCFVLEFSTVDTVSRFVLLSRRRKMKFCIQLGSYLAIELKEMGAATADSP